MYSLDNILKHYVKTGVLSGAHFPLGEQGIILIEHESKTENDDLEPSKYNPFHIGDYVRMQPVGYIRWYYGNVDMVSGDGVRMTTERGEIVNSPYWYVQRAKKRNK